MNDFPDFSIEIGRHRDAVDALGHIESWMNLLPDRRATLMFGGYDDDPREVWEIDRCVTICKAIVVSTVFQRLDWRSALFVYRVATGMPDRVDDDFILRFVDLMCQGWSDSYAATDPLGLAECLVKVHGRKGEHK
jgi:hypothetical protein